MNIISGSKKDKSGENKEIFTRAYDDYIDQIYRFVYFKVGSKEEAQDLTSAVFLKTWDYINKNKIRKKTLRALIYKIARNAVIDYYRGRSMTQNNMESLDEGLNIIDERQDMIKSIELSMDMTLISESLGELKDEYREVIILRFTEELSISEISSILEKSKGNTRVLLFRALKALRELTDQKIK